VQHQTVVQNQSKKNNTIIYSSIC